jgi:hypothetical protein
MTKIAQYIFCIDRGAKFYVRVRIPTALRSVLGHAALARIYADFDSKRGQLDLCEVRSVNAGKSPSLGLWNPNSKDCPLKGISDRHLRLRAFRRSPTLQKNCDPWGPGRAPRLARRAKQISLPAPAHHYISQCLGKKRTPTRDASRQLSAGATLPGPRIIRTSRITSTQATLLARSLASDVNWLLNRPH